jgi:hypothetical protein
MRQDGKQQTVPRRRNPGTDPDARDARRERRIASYAPEVRQKVIDLSRGLPELEDLADSFPAALFALSVHPMDEDERAELVSSVCDGLPLRDLAERLGLPWWLRKLPAQTFVEPLGLLPTDAEVGTRISAILPLGGATAGEWLRRLSISYRICGVDAALWVARHFRSAMPIASEEHFQILCAWIWHADQPDTPAGALVRKAWSPQLSARRATEEIIAWRRRLALARHIGRGFGETWVADGTALGYEFVALRTVTDFIGEATVMDNCLDQYATRLESGPVRVFSVRRDGKTVADLEISAHEQEASMPAISQVRAPRNRRASPDVWQAAYAWLGSQPLKPADLTLLSRRPRSKRLSERVIWAPYLLHLAPDLRERFEVTIIETASGRRRTRPAAAPRL